MNVFFQFTYFGQFILSTSYFCGRHCWLGNPENIPNPFSSLQAPRAEGGNPSLFYSVLGEAKPHQGIAYLDTGNCIQSGFCFAFLIHMLQVSVQLSSPFLLNMGMLCKALVGILKPWEKNKKVLLQRFRLQHYWARATVPSFRST